MKHNFKMILLYNTIVNLRQKNIFSVTYMDHFPDKRVKIIEFYFLC